jgi:hypothetical protein
MAYTPAEITFSIDGTQPSGSSRFNNSGTYLVSNNGAPFEFQTGNHYLSTSTVGLTTASSYVPASPSRSSWLDFSISTSPATKFPVVGTTGTNQIVQNRGLPFDFGMSGQVASANRLAYLQTDGFTLAGRTSTPGFDGERDALSFAEVDITVLNRSTSVYNLAIPITFMCFQPPKIVGSLDFALNSNVTNAPGSGIFATYITVQSTYVSPNATVFSNEVLIRRSQQWSN